MRRTRLIAGVAVYALIAGATFGGIGYMAMTHQIKGSEQTIASLQRELESERQARELHEMDLKVTIDRLETLASEQRDRLGRLSGPELTATSETGPHTGISLASMSGEDSSLPAADGLDTASDRPASDDIEIALARLQDELAQLVAERDLALRQEKGLRWRVNMLETRLDRVNRHAQSTANWLEGWVGNRLGAISAVLRDAGVDPERLLARAGEASGTGQGGPFEALDNSNPEPVVRVNTKLVEEVARLDAAQRLMSAVPLAAPLDYYHVTSNFGGRKDPLNSSRAMHGGIDLGAARGSAIIATAPGKVVFAGPNGAYGNMVEIDHGLGIHTRYGHMKKVDVKVGQTVGFRQPIGIIGNTGRSTGRHLHYEIRIDDEPLDPAGFLEAGRYIVQALNG